MIDDLRREAIAKCEEGVCSGEASRSRRFRLSARTCAYRAGRDPYAAIAHARVDRPYRRQETQKR